jgi:hypothetical protein
MRIRLAPRRSPWLEWREIEGRTQAPSPDSVDLRGNGLEGDPEFGCPRPAEVPSDKALWEIALR